MPHAALPSQILCPQWLRKLYKYSYHFKMWESRKPFQNCLVLEGVPCSLHDSFPHWASPVVWDGSFLLLYAFHKTGHLLNGKWDNRTGVILECFGCSICLSVAAVACWDCCVAFIVWSLLRHPIFLQSCICNDRVTGFKMHCWRKMYVEG